MLKKCLKYDFKAIFRYWWVASAIMLSITPLGAICLRLAILNSGTNPEHFDWEILGAVLYFFALGAYSVFMGVILYIRYFKHLFSDEGYLTFTLPVKRQTLFVSKLLNHLIWTAITSAFIAAILAFVLSLAPSKHNGTILLDVINAILEVFLEAAKHSASAVFALILSILLSLLTEICACLLLYLLITFSCTIIKKARVIAGIGIGYLAYYAFAIIVFIIVFMASAVVSNADVIFANGLSHPLLIVNTFLITACVFVSFVSVIAIFKSISLLEKRLNMA